MIVVAMSAAGCSDPALGKAAVPCTVRNLSETGACLQVQTTYGIQSTFAFAVDDKPLRACKVTWLDGTMIGVQFQ